MKHWWRKHPLTGWAIRIALALFVMNAALSRGSGLNIQPQEVRVWAFSDALASATPMPSPPGRWRPWLPWA